MSSAYTNTNYATQQPPPPTTTGGMNLVNGMPGQQYPPQPQQQQQHQQLQQQQQAFAQQHQNVLQQKLMPPTQQPPQMQQGAPQTKLQQPHQQQQPNASLYNNANISKFMPPAASTPNSYVPAAATTQPPTTATTNGPSTHSIASAAQRLPPVASAANALPPHLRPPGMNGPAGAPGGGNLTNGAATPSANSSRTASPALQAMPPMTQQQQPQQQQQPFGAMPPNARPPMPASGAGANSLSGSMQNLNLNRANGPAAPMQQQTQPQQQPQQFPPNFQNNFRTSALQAPAQPPTAAGQPPMGANMPPPTTATATNNMTNAMQSQARPPPTTAAGPPLGGPAMPGQPKAATPYGTSTSPLMPVPQQPPQQQPQQPHNANFPPMSGQPPPQQAAMNQNVQNNNLQHQLPHGQQQGMQQQPPAPQPQSQQRKPMYPTNAQLPQMPAQQQQMAPQQGYMPPYQQPAMPMQQPGMFNGQRSTGPLQYQAQAPQQQQQQQQPQMQQQYAGGQMPYNTPSVVQQGFNSLWGQDTIDLMQTRHILTPATLLPPRIVLHNQFHESINCNPNIMRCTIAKIPESNSLLQKSRLPLGIVIHPFRDINSLPVIQCPNIVRCRLCRTYINPFVYFVDSKMWKCNLCYRSNELPEDFQFDPATKTYGDVTRRPEVRSSTIEFIAPSEYMLRPPQPAMYLFLFDVSIIAQQSGYLENACATLMKHLDDMPGDARTQVGFIAYNSQVHFYSMADGYSQPHEMTLLDIDDPFLPRPDNLLVNLKECKELVKDLLTQLPKRFADTHDPGSALGAALQVAHKLMQSCGGRITVFQTCLPNKGPGALEAREDPNNRSAKDVAHLNPATDFYKRYALDCSGYQIAVDLFLLNQQYSDMATISGISKHSGGCVHHFPLYQKTRPQLVESFTQCFKRYLTRKIGFEAVMRIRCTRGLQVHTFHGNFFVRSTDLLSLPNVNPDAGYGMQISYEESLSDVKTICFQAALLYTNSEGERRIRVHTLCLPVASTLPEVMHAADTEAIMGLLSKMAVDRSITSNVADAREAFLNATVDVLNAFKVAQNLPSGQSGQLVAPRSLALMPLYIAALLKHPAFRVGTSTRLDDRVYAMDCMKTLPLDQLMKFIYPEFYQIDALLYNAQNSNHTTEEDDEDDLPELQRLQLSAEYLDSRSIFLLDCGQLIILYVGLNVPTNILEATLGIKSTAELPDYCYGLPNVNSPENDALKRFMMRLNDEKPYAPLVQIIRDTSTAKPQFIEKLVDDRSESSLSYYEFLQHLRTQVK